MAYKAANLLAAYREKPADVIPQDEAIFPEIAQGEKAGRRPA
ncbi:MAG: hypothetical protein ACLQDM_26220 [Bradyrhizobium sp.]